MPTITPVVSELEYDALKNRAAYFRPPAPGVLALTGDDAAEFLQGQVTNDVAALKVGDGVYAALLSPKGKVRADMRVLRSGGERLLVIADDALLPLITKTINTFKVGFRFTVTDNAGHVALLSLIGPHSADLLAAVVDRGAPPADGENASAPIGRGDFSARAIRTLLGIDLLGETGDIEHFAAALDAAGVPELSPAAAAVARVEHGVPRFGLDFGEQNFLDEAGLNERAVSFTKGCYVGQETVARMHYKGRPNRHLRTLSADRPLRT
ncbi:MAG: folate-binding protein, partial [Solirubrobacterales bacterium]